MSKPKYKKGDRVVVKPNIYEYGGKTGRIIGVYPPFYGANKVTVYTVKFDDGDVNDFTGWELKTPTPEQSQEYGSGCLKGGFAMADQLFRKGAKEALEKTPVVKDIDWSDFKSGADKEWESFIK